MTNHIRRRDFITLVGGAAVTWPVAAKAQQPAAMRMVGYIDSTVAAAAAANRVSGFRQGLSEAGFVEGRNVAIDFRWAERQFDRLPAIAVELVRRQVAVIVVDGPAVAAAKAATSTIPIVFVTGGDPIDTGLV